MYIPQKIIQHRIIEASLLFIYLFVGKIKNM